jgi:DNA-binding response OmpR family regulator
MSSFSVVSQFKATILIVDDTPNNLQLLFRYLKDADYKLLVAQDGKKAIKIAESVRPHLILLDIMMSVMDGFETCRRLKHNSDTKDIPIIFMTAISKTESKVKGFELGAVDYITKPIDRQELLARIKTHLTLQNLYRQLAKETEKKQLLFEISDCIRQSLDLNLIFQTATTEMLKAIEGDRIALIRLNNENIEIEAESVAGDRVSKLSKNLAIECFSPSQKEYELYRQGKIQTIENIDINTEVGSPVLMVISFTYLNKCSEAELI